MRKACILGLSYECSPAGSGPCPDHNSKHVQKLV